MEAAAAVTSCYSLTLPLLTSRPIRRRRQTSRSHFSEALAIERVSSECQKRRARASGEQRLKVHSCDFVANEERLKKHSDSVFTWYLSSEVQFFVDLFSQNQMFSPR